MLEKFCKMNVVAMFNDMKDFCCLDLKSSVTFCFSSNMFEFISDPLHRLAR